MAKVKTPPTLRDQVESLLGQYEDLDRRADEAIDTYIAGLRCPGVPLGVVRQCEFEGYARGYSRALALERLRQKLA